MLLLHIKFHTYLIPHWHFPHFLYLLIRGIEEAFFFIERTYRRHILAGERKVENLNILFDIIRI